MTSLQLTQTMWLGLLAVAASSDVASRRIPNAAVVLVAALGLVLRLGDGGIAGAAASIATALAVATPLVLTWRSGLCGGGDVKLAAAAACGIGAAGVLDFLAATALAGGSLAVATLLADRAARPPLRAYAAGTALATPAAAGRLAGRSVPYGAAIAIGAAYALWSGGIR